MFYDGTFGASESDPAAFHTNNNGPSPSPTRSMEHTPKSIRELETVAEVRLGQAQTIHGGQTIIPSDEPTFDVNDNDTQFPLATTYNNNPGANRRRNAALTPAQLREQQQQQASSSAGNPSLEQALIDFIIWAVKGFLELFYPSSGNDYLIQGGLEDRTSLNLTDEDIDNLAVFQGNLNDFVELQQGQVSPRKIEKMKSLLTDDNHLEWERRCMQLMNPILLHHPMIVEFHSHRAKLRAFLGTWNPAEEHCSDNIYLLDDQITAHRIPMVNQTDAVRSKLGVLSGVHAWDVKVAGPIGTHFSIGVSTDKTLLQTNVGYVSLIGDEAESWGWDLVWGNVSNNGKAFGDYPRTVVYQYQSEDVIRMILDCNKGELSFAVNEMFFGKAFTNLPTDLPLYPTVGLVYGNIEVTLVYLGPPPPLRN